MLEFKEKLSQELKKFWESDEKIYTAWEGGAVATGFDDDFSDLDMALICDDEYVEELFENTEKYLSENYGIEVKFRMPEPCWHGHSQAFYLLKDSPKFFYIDLLIQKLSTGNRFMESNRHGNSFVWFDKKDIMDGTPVTEETIKQQVQQKFNYFKTSFIFTKMELEKQILRGREVDALDGYYKLILGRLAFLFNLKNRPAKHDFGLLYSYREWEKVDHEFVKDLLYVKDIVQFKIKSDRAIAKVEELTNTLEDKWGK